MSKLTPTDDRMSVLRRRISKELAGFEGGLPKGCDPWSLRGGRPRPELFPVPELVLFALRDLMGFPTSGVGEKVRWSVYATVDDQPFMFELRKFGFAIGYRDGTAPALVRRVEGQLSRSLRVLEPFLQERAREQIAVGNLTMANKFSEFDNRYRYFRSLADLAFTTKEEAANGPARRPGVDHLRTDMAELTMRMNRSMRRQAEGYFASGAMVDAFFSRLEHRLLLLRAFIGRELAVGEFETFLQLSWDQRLRQVAQMGSKPEQGRLVGKLREIKENVRNPLAHGGVENDGGAFYFHLERVGAIPANLSRYRGRLQASFFPIAHTTHADLCRIFDEVDTVLAEGDLELPNEFVRWGIDPQFDAAALQSYAQAIAGGPEATEALIDKLGREWERHVNMDY